MESPGRLLVEIQSGHASPWSGEFAKHELTVGRGPACDVRLHPTKDILCATKVHFRIIQQGAEIEVACDHANGITIDRDGDKSFLDAGQSLRLLPGFEVIVGSNGPRLSVSSLDGPLPGTLKGRGATARSLPAQPEARLSGDVVATARSGRRLGFIGLALLTLTVIGGAAWAWRNEGKLQQLRTHRDAQFDLIIADQQSLKSTLERKSPTDALRQALAAAIPSVFVVGAERNGGFDPAGTAWVAAPGKLITNAHVANRLESDRLSGARLVARRGGDATGSLEVTSLEVHPAFKPWSALLSQAAVKSGRGETSADLVAIADLAVLTVRGDAGPPLPLASEAELPKTGDPIGYVGFPTEGISSVPTLQTVIGTVTAITDPFFGRAIGREGVLVHLSVIASGGASGSPIIDARGHVVAILSAGSVITIGEGASAKRVPMGLNFGQSAVLARELLDGSALAAQAQREGPWRQSLSRVFVPPAQRLESKVTELQTTLHAKPELVSDQEVQVSTQLGYRTSVRLDAGYHYVFLAAAQNWDDLTLAIGAGGNADDWWRSERAVVTAVLKRAEEARTVDVVVKAPNTGSTAISTRFRVMRVKG